MRGMRVKAVMMRLRNDSFRIVGLIAIAIGISLHLAAAATAFEHQPQSLTITILVWSCLPYLLALLLIFTIRRAVIPMVGALAPLLMDIVNYYALYVAVPASTGGLNFFWVPLWNLFIVEPIALAVGWLIARRR
jgi:hypothetical protein